MEKDEIVKIIYFSGQGLGVRDQLQPSNTTIEQLSNKSSDFRITTYPCSLSIPLQNSLPRFYKYQLRCNLSLQALLLF